MLRALEDKIYDFSKKLKKKTKFRVKKIIFRIFQNSCGMEIHLPSWKKLENNKKKRKEKFGQSNNFHPSNSLPPFLKNGTFRVSRSASWRAAAALFKIPSRAAASHDSLTIRVICNSFLVVLAPTSAVRNVFLLRRWWPAGRSPLHTDLSRVEKCSSLGSRLVFPSLSPSFSLSSEERRERERGGRNLRSEEGCWGMVARIGGILGKARV